MRGRFAELRFNPNIDTCWQSTDTSSGGPVSPATFFYDSARFSYLSMVATVVAPMTVAAPELRLECMFAANEATARYHALVVDSAGVVPAAPIWVRSIDTNPSDLSQIKRLHHFEALCRAELRARKRNCRSASDMALRDGQHNC